MAQQQPTKEQQKILAGFKKLREEQQAHVSELQRNAGELRETQNVLKTLNNWDNSQRKFYYRTVDALLEMDGTSIVERLTNNIADLEQKSKSAEEGLKVKGEELQKYISEHNIQIKPQ